MRAGDLNFRQESYEQALSFYEDAAGILTAMMDQTFILSLENLQPRFALLCDIKEKR